MLELITRADAYAHLRLDFDSNGSADDPWLNIMIPAVSEAVRNWLKDDHRLYEPEVDADGSYVYDSNGDTVPALDSNGDRTVRYVVRAAVLIELSSQYRFREGEGDNVVASHEGHGYTLSKGATALLSCIRRPTVV